MSHLLCHGGWCWDGPENVRIFKLIFGFLSHILYSSFCISVSLSLSVSLSISLSLCLSVSLSLSVSRSLSISKSFYYDSVCLSLTCYIHSSSPLTPSLYLPLRLLLSLIMTIWKLKTISLSLSSDPPLCVFFSLSIYLSFPLFLRLYLSLYFSSGNFLCFSFAV